MFRYCLIGSLVFHIIVLLGVGFCLPRYTTPGLSGQYFQVEAFAVDAVGTGSEAEPAKHNLKLKPKNRDNGESLDEAILVEPSDEITMESAGDPSPIVLPVESEKTLEQSSNPAGVFIGSGHDSTGRVGEKNTMNAGPEGGSLSYHGGTKLSLAVADLPPQKIYFPSPEYPWKAKRNNWEGTVHLRAEVLPNGKIGEILILDSSGYEILDQAARKAIKTWRFKPALKNGTAVICYKEIPVRFQLEE